VYNAKAYSAASATSPLASATIPRRDSTERDVQLEILFCGICHSDLHQVRNEWRDVMPTVYPCVPGHEIVGRVTRVGSAVTRYKAGDLVAVGCMVDSDRTCHHCREGLEQFCPNLTLTYNSPDKYLGGVTYGGYSESIVVDEHFVLRVPSNLDLAGAAPLLCAGITTYSPMRHWGVSNGKKVGVVGLGGLGHMGVKFAHAFGAHVVVCQTIIAESSCGASARIWRRHIRPTARPGLGGRGSRGHSARVRALSSMPPCFNCNCCFFPLPEPSGDVRPRMVARLRGNAESSEGLAFLCPEDCCICRRRHLLRMQ
jgi:Zn-dependent alcohol dehydrogenase